VKNLLRELHCASTQQKVCILSEKGVIHWPRTSTPKTKYFFTFTSTSAECERNRSTLRVTSEISCVYTNCRRCKHACLLLRLPQTMLHVSGTSPLKCHRHDWPQCNLFQLNCHRHDWPQCNLFQLNCHRHDWSQCNLFQLNCHRHDWPQYNLFQLNCHRHDWPQCNLFQLNSAQIQGLETLSGCED